MAIIAGVSVLRQIRHGPAKLRRAWSISSAISTGPAVLQIIPALDAGGAERTTIDIARALTHAGLGAIVATKGGRLEPQLESAGGEIVHLPLDSKAPHRMLGNALRLGNVAIDHNVKVIHARSRAPAWSAFVASRLVKIPFVTTYHGIYNASNALKRFYNSIMVRSDAIIANSQWTADHIVEEHGIARDRINVVPRGVDFDEIDPAGVSADRVKAARAAWGANDRDVVVLLPGRLTRWKGQLILIAALAELQRSEKLGPVRAVILGDAQGRDDYVAELRAAVAADGLEDRVLIAPHTQDMPAAYMASDIVVSASTDPEAFGRVAPEASAMGRPVIATNHGGARETVRHGISGLLVPPDDAQALSTAIERLASMTPAERAAMGEQGRAHVRENFSLERMCADTLAVYRELIGD